ncbi:hypothetical protein KXV83_001801 [Aspergillus fumigatus]|nr:hypothetical protein KXV83_001801 [Aspergillus fumigatus]KAH2980025.1 hypothetical protein KXW58_003114 [Aspergillus fumigatus]
MVKPDVNRDYYLDLGLTATANEEDIKKQYRKLARKFHPDRNPGREHEFKPKFQAIQAAHEILSDPQQRRKYDIDRLQAGYGNRYGPPKPDTPRRTPANPYASATPPKAQTSRQPFSGRPQSSHSAYSTGTQSYANYWRSGPKPPWEKAYGAGRTGADAYRRFQGTWGNSTTGWSRFNPRTARAGYTDSVPRPNATPTGQPTRPKTAYEYFKKPTDQSSRTQSTPKKHGFAPRSASGDEPMAANTSSYTTVPRRERFQAPDDYQREAAPTTTTEKPAAPSGCGTENTREPNSKQTGGKNAGTDGDRASFSESGHHSDDVRDPPKRSSAQSRTPHTGWSSPGSERRKSACSKSRSHGDQKCNFINSSDTDDTLARETRTIPKSRPQNHSSKQPASDPNLTPNVGQAPINGTFKRRSRDDLRKAFTAEDWRGDFEYGSFTSPATENDRPDTDQSLNSHGQASARASTSRPGQPDLFGQGLSRSPSVSWQPHRAFPKAKFSLQEWADAFKSWLVFIAQHEAPQQENAQRPRGSSKRAKPRYRALRTTPQPASVATEAEEVQNTIRGSIVQEATGGDPGDVEAMDLD